MSKKYLMFMAFVLISSVLFAQVIEGYGGLPWGTSIIAAKEKFLNLIDYTDDQDKLTNQKVFDQKNASNTKILRFFNNKLYWARTAYENVDTATLQALIEKLTETYGNFDNSGKGTDSGNEYLWSSKKYSKELEIELRVIFLYDTFGRNTSNMVFITYENPTIRDELYQYEKNVKKNDLEL